MIRRPVVALLAPGLLLAACSGAPGDSPAATGQPAPPTVRGTAPAGGVPVDTELLPGLPIHVVPGGYDARTFTPGEHIQEHHGAYFMDSEGTVERVSLPSAAADLRGRKSHDQPRYPAVNDDNTLILAADHDGEWLIDRGSAQLLGWDPDALMVGTLGRDRLVFEFRDRNEDRTRLAVVNRDFSAFDTIEIPAPPLSQSHYALTGDEETLLVHGIACCPQQGETRVFLVDLRDGTVTDISADFAPPAGHEAAEFVIAEPGLDDAFAVYFAFRPLTGDGPGLRSIRIYGTDGALRSQTSGGGYMVQAAPDGSRIAWEEEVAALPSIQKFGSARWPAVVVADATSGEVLFRVNGASLSYGDFLQGSRWLADSSGIVVAGGDAGFGETAYSVVARDGSAVTALAGSPYVDSEAPLPSTADPGLLSLGRTSIAGIDGARFASAGSDANDAGIAVTPWGAVGEQLRFTFDRSRPDGPRPFVRIVPPRVEFPPFTNALLLVAATPGDCLNLRSLPENTGLGASDIVDCLPDSAAVMPTPLGGTVETPAPIESTSYYIDREGSVWLHVRTPDGAEGWASSEFLAWAP